MNIRSKTYKMFDKRESNLAWKVDTKPEYEPNKRQMKKSEQMHLDE